MSDQVWWPQRLVVIILSFSRDPAGIHGLKF